MLPTSAVRRYLARPFADWRVYKQLKPRQRDALARHYGIPAALWAKTKGRRHQQIMILIGIRAKRFAFWADTGMGKSFVSLVLARTFRDRGEVKRMLLLVPQRTNKDEWEFLIHKHMPDLSYTVLPSNITGKWQALTTDGLLLIETYAGLHHMLCKKTVNRKGRSKLAPDPTLVRRLAKHIDGLILDESPYAKTKNKLPFRLCRAIAKGCSVRLALSGTPLGRDPTDLWGQMFLIDDGATLGETLGLFRAVFFGASSNYFGGFTYTFHKRKQALLNDILANASIRFKAKDADLPARVDIREQVRLPRDARSYYARAKAALLQATNFREMKNSFLRMRQISSGFVGYHDDDAGTKMQFEFPECPKRERLLSKLASALPAKQIVFYEFTWSAMRLRQDLDRLGIGWQHLWSGSKDTKRVIDLWKQDDRYPVLLLQNQFGIGLNLQQASYAHFYESPVSPIIRTQCERRVVRQEGEHATVFIYDYVTKDTADDKILDLLKQGFDLMANIIDGRKRLEAA